MNTVSPEEVNKIIVEVLSRRVYLPNVSSESVSVQYPWQGHRFHFQVRLNKHYKVLPPAEVSKKIYEKTGKKAEGVWYLMLGSLTILDNVLRVFVRIVEVETSVIKHAVHADGDLIDEGLRTAFEQALVKLGINYVA